jgi:hypothetical protein
MQWLHRSGSARSRAGGAAGRDGGERRPDVLLVERDLAVREAKGRQAGRRMRLVADAVGGLLGPSSD